MTTPHRAASSHWDYVQMRAENPCPSKTASCLLELRDRLAAAEQRIRELEATVRANQRESFPTLDRALRNSAPADDAATEAPADHLRDATEMVATDEELYEIWNEPYSLGDSLRAVYNLGRQHGATRRASMDLTRALADLRRPM